MVWTTIPTIQVIGNMSSRGCEPNTKSMLIQENIHNAQFTNTGITMNPHTTVRSLERVYEVISINIYTQNIKENHKSEIQQKLKTKIKNETDTNEQTSTV